MGRKKTDRSRRKFAGCVYLITICMLLISLGQWLTVVFVPQIGDIFEKYEWISVIFFSLSIILALVFIFFEAARFVKCLNVLLALVIMEFAIIGLFALIVKTLWPELLIWFFICLVLLFVFILVGSVLSHDLTMDVVIMFVISFIFLIISVFLIMLHLLTQSAYSYILSQIFVSSIILTFVMYHAQTINGGRFAEMRVNDYLLASIILFYDFTVMFLLTFYVQIQFKIASSKLLSPTAALRTTTKLPGNKANNSFVDI